MGYSSGMQSKRVSVLNQVAERNTFGRETEFEYVGTFWFGETFNKGVKSMREGALDAYDRVMFRCRSYVPVKRASMLVYKGKTYQIESYNDDYEANEIQITAVETPGKDLSYLLPQPYSTSELGEISEGEL